MNLMEEDLIWGILIQSKLFLVFAGVMCLGFVLRRIKKWQTEEMKKGKDQAEMQMSATEKEKTLREIEGNL